ncbi:MAG: cellulose synthase [Actinobacteria bacterium]|nr:cellulose synthase [Actinomycetota bacterium]
MSTYDQIAWLPLCAGLTGLGLVLSFLAMRRRGVRSGLRWAAWSLLPLAADLTGAIEMFWKMGVAVADFAKGFVFSPKVWAGIALAGLALVLFTVSGSRRRRRVSGGRKAGAAAPAAGPAGTVTTGSRSAGGQLATRPAATAPAATRPAPAAPAATAPAKARKGKNADDDDLDADVADILRRHGIT